MPGYNCLPIRKRGPAVRERPDATEAPNAAPKGEGFDYVAAYLHPWDCPRNEVPEWNQDVERAYKRLEKLRGRVFALIEPDRPPRRLG